MWDNEKLFILLIVEEVFDVVMDGGVQVAIVAQCGKNAEDIVHVADDEEDAWDVKL